MIREKFTARAGLRSAGPAEAVLSGPHKSLCLYHNAFPRYYQLVPVEAVSHQKSAHTREKRNSRGFARLRKPSALPKHPVQHTAAGPLRAPVPRDAHGAGACTLTGMSSPPRAQGAGGPQSPSTATRGSHAKALPWYEQVRAAAAAAGDDAGVGRACQELGTCYANMGQHAKALPLYEQARAAAVAAGDGALVGRACQELGTCYAYVRAQSGEERLVRAILSEEQDYLLFCFRYCEHGKQRRKCRECREAQALSGHITLDALQKAYREQQQHLEAATQAGTLKVIAQRPQPRLGRHIMDGLAAAQKLLGQDNTGHRTRCEFEARHDTEGGKVCSRLCVDSTHACMRRRTAKMPVRVLAGARARACPCLRMHACTAHARACSRAQTHVPGADPKSLCLLHLQVNVARLLNGLGDTTLLHPDNSALGITVRRSAQYDSIMEANGSMREEIEKLRADLAQMQNCVQTSRCTGKNCVYTDTIKTMLEHSRAQRKELQRMQTELTAAREKQLEMQGVAARHQHALQHLRREHEHLNLQHQEDMQYAREKRERDLQHLRQEHQHTLHILAASSCMRCAAHVTAQANIAANIAAIICNV